MSESMANKSLTPISDREGVAIIMCEKHLETKYSLLSTGGSHLESTLHHNLTEHINSEIGLAARYTGTISSVDTAKQWLRGTLLFRRIQKNPSHYNVGIDISGGATWEECMDALVVGSLRVLLETQLIRTGDSENDLILTDFGEIMSVSAVDMYYIRRATMKTFIEVSNVQEACLRSLLLAISGAEEFKDTLMRVGERQMYQKLGEHESIRYPTKKAESSSDKVSLLIQAVLGGAPLMSNDFKSLSSQPHMEALNVMRHAPRMIAGTVSFMRWLLTFTLVDIALVAKNGAVIVNGTSLMRSINAKAWEDRPVVLKQLEGIGEKSYSVSIVETSTIVNHAKSALDVTLSITISAKLSQGKANRFSKNFDTRGSSILTVLSDNQYVDFRRISTKVLLESAGFSVTASLTKPSQTITIIVAPVKFAGITERFDFKPSPPANAYPTLNTRPLKESEYPAKLDVPDEYVLDLTGFGKGRMLQLMVKQKFYQKSPHIRKGGTWVPSSPVYPTGITREYHQLGVHSRSITSDTAASTSGDHLIYIYVRSCREGLPKPPPSPKQAKAKKPVGSVVLSSPVRPAQAQGVKNISEKHKSQLDHMHGRASDGTSSIKPGSSIRLKDPPPPGSTSRYVDYLPSDPTGPTVSAQAGTLSSGSDNELPSPSAISFSKKEVSIDSPDSYDDSEMDLWAANIPSEVLDVEEDGSIFFPVSERSRAVGQPPKPTTPLRRKGNKRPSDLAEEPERSEHTTKRPRPSFTNPEEVIDLATPTPTPERDARKVPPAPLAVPPLREAHKPLFRPSSFPFPPAAVTPVPAKQPRASLATHGPPNAKPKSGGYDDDIEKFLDDVFEGVKIIPGDEQSTAKRQNNPVTPRLSSTVTKDTHAFSSGIKPSPVMLQEQTYEVSSLQPKETKREQRNSDPMAELNAWLEENGL
ncbi:Sec63 [Ceratobasidium sp. 414]|nr:Sec63 [Ceratobasidium sp. 414]